MTMNDPVRILSISDDDGLRFSRELLLESQGYATESVTSRTPLSAPSVRSFDIALICRSVDADRAIALTERLRRYNPAIQIMCIAPPDSTKLPEVDVQVQFGPEPLLEAIRALCEQRAPVHLPSRGKMARSEKAAIVGPHRFLHTA